MAYPFIMNWLCPWPDVKFDSQEPASDSRIRKVAESSLSSSSLSHLYSTKPPLPERLYPAQHSVWPAEMTDEAIQRIQDT